MPCANEQKKKGLDVAPEQFALRHFYYGQFVKNGKPAGDMRLLAKTAGLSEEAIAEALQLARIPPMPGVDNGAWALVRGKRAVPYLLVEAEVGDAQQTMLHYVILPNELVRSLGGNLRLLQPLINGKMPAYNTVGNELNPLMLAYPHPPEPEQEIDDILDLMTFTRNRIQALEAMLSSIVKGHPIHIQNAPTTYEDRMIFISGLLMLLPPSVRFAGTFTTHTLTNSKIDALIRFVSGEPDPGNHVYFDWQSGKITGEVPEDDYSRYVISQLRLDAELVVQQTRKLTEIASWRVKSNDRLAEALAYASKRRSVDEAVMNNQAVEVSDVANFLMHDPTLDHDTSLAYARHLLSFSAALSDLEHLKSIAELVGQDIELADIAYQQLQEAYQNGAAGDIFDLLINWLKKPLGPQDRRWIELIHQCAITYLQDVVDDGDIAEATIFLRDVDRSGTIIAATEVIPNLIDITLPIASVNQLLSQTIFIMAAKHLPATHIYDILVANPMMVENLSEEMQHYVRALRANNATETTGSIVVASSKFETAQRLILVRLVELALLQKNHRLIDTPVLKQLVRIGVKPLGRLHYPAVLLRLVQDFSEESILTKLEGDDSWLILSILLALGDYNQLAKRILEQSRLLYLGRQTEFSTAVRKIFAETPIPETEIAHALDEIGEGGIRSLPLIMAYIGTLEAHKPSEITDAVAADVSEMLDADPGVLEIIPLEAVVAIVRYHIKQQDAEQIHTSTRILAWVAARYGIRPAKTIGQIYRRLTWSKVAKVARMEMLRVYIRFLERDAAWKVVEQSNKLTGDRIQSELEATYILKVLMNDHDLPTYAEMLHQLASYLKDTAEAYGGRNVPTPGGIHNELDSMPGSLNREERAKIAEDIVQSGKIICALGEAHKRIRGSDSNRRIESILNAETDPESALEVMRLMGGYLAEGKRYVVELKEQPHPHPLPRRNTNGFMREVDTIHYLLAGIQQAVSESGKSLKAKAIQNEIDSLWQGLARDQQEQLKKDLAADLQIVAELIPEIAKKGDARALEDTGLGRRLENNKARPRNTLEFYRYVAGYYRMRS